MLRNGSISLYRFHINIGRNKEVGEFEWEIRHYIRDKLSSSLLRVRIINRFNPSNKGRQICLNQVGELLQIDQRNNSIFSKRFHFSSATSSTEQILPFAVSPFKEKLYNWDK